MTQKFLFFCFLSFFHHTYAQEIKGQVYEQDSHKSKLIFNYKSNFTSSLVETEFKDLNGQIAVREKGELKEGKIVKYEIFQEQINAHGLIEVKDGRVFFTLIKNGKTKTEDEKLKDTLVVSSNFRPFIQSQWATLTQGKEVDLRYAVWNRLETIGFTLKKVGEENIDGLLCSKIQMKPTSFIIAALVKPVYLYYSNDGQKIVKMNGRIPPMYKVGDDWKDLDAEIYYQAENGDHSL